MTTLAHWRPILTRLFREVMSVIDEFCICTRCQDERMFERNRQKAQGKKK